MAMTSASFNCLSGKILSKLKSRTRNTWENKTTAFVLGKLSSDLNVIGTQRSERPGLLHIADEFKDGGMQAQTDELIDLKIPLRRQCGITSVEAVS